MDPLHAAILACGVMFVSSFVRSAIGFGDSMIALPLLCLMYPLDHAVPLIACMSVVISAILTAQQWKDVRFTNAKHFAIACTLGLYPGMLFLNGPYQSSLRIVLGLTVAGFAIFRLIYKDGWKLKTDKSLYAWGFAGGILGGAFGMNGPPIVIFGTLRGWSPKEFRATLQAFFLVTGPLILAVLGIGGSFTAPLFLQLSWTLPVALIALFVGQWVAKQWSTASYQRYVYLFLIAMGSMLIITSFIGAET